MKTSGMPPDQLAWVDGSTYETEMDYSTDRGRLPGCLVARLFGCISPGFPLVRRGLVGWVPRPGRTLESASEIGLGDSLATDRHLSHRHSPVAIGPTGSADAFDRSRAVGGGADMDGASRTGGHGRGDSARVLRTAAASQSRLRATQLTATTQNRPPGGNRLTTL